MSDEIVLMTVEQFNRLAVYAFGEDFNNQLARVIAEQQGRPLAPNDPKRVADMRKGKRKISPVVVSALLSSVSQKLEPHLEVSALRDAVSSVLADFDDGSPS